MGTEALGLGGAFPGELRSLLIQLLILPGDTCQGWWSGKTVGVWDVSDAVKPLHPLWTFVPGFQVT